MSLNIDNESVDIEFQKLILKFYPDAEIDQTDEFLMERYEDVKNMIIDLLNDMITEDSRDEI